MLRRQLFTSCSLELFGKAQFQPFQVIFKSQLTVLIWEIADLKYRIFRIVREFRRYKYRLDC